MSPDEAYYDKQAKTEAEKLKQKVNALSEEQKKQIYEKGWDLLRLSFSCCLKNAASCLVGHLQSIVNTLYS